MGAGNILSAYLQDAGSSSWDAELIFTTLSSMFAEVGEAGKKSTFAVLYNCRVLSELYLLVHRFTN